MRKQYSTSLDTELIKKLKLIAVEQEKAANDIIEEALKLWLEVNTKDKE